MDYIGSPFPSLPLPSYWWFSCLSLPTAGITGIYYPAEKFFLLYFKILIQKLFIYLFGGTGVGTQGVGLILPLEPFPQP
jgi:hypothetical protein